MSHTVQYVKYNLPMSTPGTVANSTLFQTSFTVPHIFSAVLYTLWQSLTIFLLFEKHFSSLCPVGISVIDTWHGCCYIPTCSPV
jgi:hypothetical protein